MSNLLIGMFALAGILAIVVAFRIYQEKQREKQEREDRERIDASLAGIGAMSNRRSRSTGYRAAAPTSEAPVDAAHFPYSAAAIQSGVGMTIDPTPLAADSIPEPARFSGGGGTYDGGGASADWDRSSPSTDSSPSSSSDSSSSSSSSDSSSPSSND